MFKQNVAGTLDRTAPSQSPEHSADERRLASAELAGQRYDHPATQAARKSCSRKQGGIGVGKELAALFYNQAGSPRPRLPRTATMTPPQLTPRELDRLADEIRGWGLELGFANIGIADTELSTEEARLIAWLDAGRHGEMDYMARHGILRARPGELVGGTLRIISARLDYLPRHSSDATDVLGDSRKAYVSRYALGRDYHKVLRSKLQRLADRIAAHVGDFQYRVFTDSAPVLEVALAVKAGLGWRGKHTLALTREAGSFFFLGEIYTDLPLPTTPATSAHCGTCEACIAACPTGAIVAPYELDASRCISYLTIELKGSIPEHLRPLIGNRVYGCDDCQLVCPWNKYAQASDDGDFAVRNGLDNAELITLFAWS